MDRIQRRSAFDFLAMVTCLAFVAASILILAVGESRTLGIFGIAFFGTCASFYFLPDRETWLLMKYRWRFRRGPVGSWYTRLGGGFEITHGSNVRFNADGTGTFWYWGGPDEDPSGEIPIEWRSVGIRRIEIRKQGEGEWEVVNYDFSVRRNEYDLVEVCIFQPDQKWGIEESGFWWSAYRLVHSNESASNCP